MQRLFRPFALLSIAAGLFIACLPRPSAAQALPQRIDDREFWQMVVGMSEPGGSFLSDNIMSNEVEFQRPIPDLLVARPGGVYVGVGPEQNFTYIVALQPSMAFIVDIRRGNLLLHLIYKAIIELSGNRVAFMSRLFARQAPAGLGRDAAAGALFRAFEAAPVDRTLAETTLREILDRLTETHQFQLRSGDGVEIAKIYRALYSGGPDVRGDFGAAAWIPSYAQLMTETDLSGTNHSYLESEQNYRVLREYESRNLIVPLVGDFAGRKTLRTLGMYVRSHRTTVGTFYTSNVEDYLYRSGAEGRFIANVSALPIDARSLFIRSFFTHTDAGLRTLLDPIAACLAAAGRGEIRSYDDLVGRSKAPVQ